MSRKDLRAARNAICVGDEKTKPRLCDLNGTAPTGAGSHQGRDDRLEAADKPHLQPHLHPQSEEAPEKPSRTEGPA